MAYPPPVLILANGEPPSAELLRERAARAGWFVCCDGAVAVALAAGLPPDAVVGDLDSAPAELPAGVEVIRLAEQDTHDLEKALYTAVARGWRRVVVLGAGGRRWDLFHANLSAFARYADRLEIEAGDGWGWLTLLTPGVERRWPLPVGSVLSLLPLPRATGVTITGVRWPLTAATLALDGPLGVSNEALGPVTVRYDTGCLGFYEVGDGGERRRVEGSGRASM